MWLVYKIQGAAWWKLATTVIVLRLSPMVSVTGHQSVAATIVASLILQPLAAEMRGTARAVHALHSEWLWLRQCSAGEYMGHV